VNRLTHSLKRGGVTLAVVAMATAAATASALGSTSGNVPFVDPSAHGYIALCDLDGHNVTSGNIHTAPFVWQAVSSLPAPDNYSGKGQNTGLLMFQPRRGVSPADWNGDEMTAATQYKGKKYPAAEATYKDFSLEDFIKEYPSGWDGLYQLRLHFAKKNYGVYTQTYPATVIQVTGNTWHVVQGGTMPCKAVHARSTEYTVGIPQVDPTSSAGETPPTAAPSTQASPAAQASGGSSGVSPSSSGGPSSDPDSVIAAPVSGVPSGTSSSSSNATVIALGALCGVLILVIAAGIFWRWRENRAPR
jgi:hypothetical protein